MTNLLFSKEEPNLSPEALSFIAEEMKNQEAVVPLTMHSDRCPFWSLAWSYFFGQPNLLAEDLVKHVDWVLETLKKTKLEYDILDYYKSTDFAKEVLNSFVTIPPIAEETLYQLTGHSSELVRLAAQANPNCPEEGRVQEILLSSQWKQ